jgi:hypothetical protein
MIGVDSLCRQPQVSVQGDAVIVEHRSRLVPTLKRRFNNAETRKVRLAGIGHNDGKSTYRYEVLRGKVLSTAEVKLPEG